MSLLAAERSPESRWSSARRYTLSEGGDVRCASTRRSTWWPQMGAYAYLATKHHRSEARRFDLGSRFATQLTMNSQSLTNQIIKEMLILFHFNILGVGL